MQTRRLSEEDGSKSDSEVWDHIFSTQEVHADKKEWMGWCEIESEPVCNCHLIHDESLISPFAGIFQYDVRTIWGKGGQGLRGLLY